MGGAVSSGENNDELVDNLMDAQYIKVRGVIMSSYDTKFRMSSYVSSYICTD